MGQDLAYNGLSPQDLASFGLTPGVDSSRPSNPLAGQGVTPEQYRQLKQMLANPNAGDAVSLPPAAVSGAVNSVTSGDGSAGAENPMNPFLELFDPKYVVPGAGIAFAAAVGLDRLYGDPTRLQNFAERLGKIPGMKAGGPQLEKALAERVAAMKNGPLKDQAMRFLKQHDSAAMNKLMFTEFVESMDRKFGGHGLAQAHYRSLDIDTIEKLSKHEQARLAMHNALSSRPMASTARIFNRVFNSTPDIRGTFEEVGGKWQVKPGANADEALKVFNAKVESHGLKFPDIKKALEHLNADDDLRVALRGKGINYTPSQFQGKMKPVRGFAKTQGLAFTHYGESLTVRNAARGQGPLGKSILHLGTFVKRSLGMEMFGNAAGKEAGVLAKLMKFAPAAMVGGLTFGIAFKEASDAESGWDKFRAFTRSMVGGTLASLAAFEMIGAVGRQSGLVNKGLSKIGLGKIAMKGLLGSKFTVGGTIIGGVMAMGLSALLTPLAEKGVDLVLGKPKMKPGKEEGASGGANPFAAAA